MPPSVKPRRVALLCLDPWQLTESVDNQPFNYAVRRIQAAIVGHEILGEITEHTLIEMRTLDVDALLERIEAFDPDVIGTSAYVWSFPTLLETCRRAKRARPERTIIFGGPSSRPEMFELPQHADGAEVVDAICIGDGEAAIQEILLSPALDRGALAKIPGLAVHDGDAWIETPLRDYGPPDVHPSPYQLGLMPDGVTAQFESFRGCPLSCAYCAWGDTGVRSRVFGHQHLVRELEALSKLDVKGTWLVDPALNLSSRAFANLSRAEAEVGALAKLGGLRCEVYPSHMKDGHLAFLESARAAYAGIGLQSYDASVLKHVDRPFDEERFDRVVAEVASIVPDTTVEIILGLPGDDPDSFKRTLERVLKLPASIRVFHCLVLPSAFMKNAPARDAMVYDPFTLQLISCRGWSREELEDTCRWLDDFAHDESGDIPHGGTWKFPRPGQRDAHRAAAGIREEPISFSSTDPPATDAGVAHKHMHDALARRVDSLGVFTLAEVTVIDGDARQGLRIVLSHTTGEVVLRAVPAEPDTRALRILPGVAYSYEKSEPTASAQALGALDRIIVLIHPITRAIISGMGDPEPTGRALPLLRS